MRNQKVPLQWAEVHVKPRRCFEVLNIGTDDPFAEEVEVKIVLQEGLRQRIE